MSSFRQKVGEKLWFAVRVVRFVGVVVVMVALMPCFMLFWLGVYALIIPYTIYEVGIRGRRRMFECSCPDHDEKPNPENAHDHT